MLTTQCAIVVERLDDDRYRASCPHFPDCEAIAATEADARQAVAEAIDRIMRQREGTQHVGWAESARPTTASA